MRDLDGGPARVRVMHGLTCDLRLAARRLAAAPVFTIFAVLSIAVGVGVATAVYSVVDAVLWRSSTVRDAHNVVVLKTGEAVASVVNVLSVPDFEDIRSAQSTLADLAASYTLLVPLQTETQTDLVSAEAVDGRYFRALGVNAALGRAIETDDAGVSASVAVLSHGLWRRRFQSDPAIVGRVVRLAGHPFEIVGVAPATFHGLAQGLRDAAIWVPSSSAALLVPAGPSSVPVRDQFRVALVGRLRTGVPLDTARSEIATLGEQLDARYPRQRRTRAGGPTRRQWTLQRIDETNREAEMMSRLGLLVVGLAALLLIVACTNLSNLVLARGTIRAPDLAVRQALGASRWRLVREQLVETTIIALLGGVGALVVLSVLRQLLAFDLSIPGLAPVSFQPEVSRKALAAAAGALLLALTVFGLEPALRLTRRGTTRVDGPSSTSAGVPSMRRQRVLLRCQVAVSAGLFMIAALFVRHVVDAARHDPGVEMSGMAVGVVNFALQGWDRTRGLRTVERIQQPGGGPAPDAIAVSSGLPFGITFTPGLELSTTDRPMVEERAQETAVFVAVTPGYFRAAGTSLVGGRDFDRRDDEGAPPVVILGAATARALFGTADILGRQVLGRVDSIRKQVEEEVRTLTVVGVAEDTDTGQFMSKRRHTAYLPLRQRYVPLVTVIGRARTAELAVAGVAAAIRAADPEAAVQSIGSGTMMLAGSSALLHGAATLALWLGGLTMMLATAGLYGIQSHVVAHRTREIGIRMSLGATSRQVERMVLAHGYAPVLHGLALGALIGIAGRALIRSILISRVTLVDGWVLVLVPIPLLVAAFWACYLPARRASRVDPNIALRHL
ncbi:MAG: ABC transporter permease [Acidobacteriota bacterium]